MVLQRKSGIDLFNPAIVFLVSLDRAQVLVNKTDQSYHSALNAHCNIACDDAALPFFDANWDFDLKLLVFDWHDVNMPVK